MVEIDFLNAKRLKEVKFMYLAHRVKGFAGVFDTITRKHNKDFEKVSYRLHPRVNDPVMVNQYFYTLKGAGLERALIGLMERCGNCLKFALEVTSAVKGWTDREMKEMVQNLFPEMMKRGMAFEILQVEPF